jgi:hypothetical protein
VNLIRDSSAPSNHLFKHLWNIVCNRLLAFLIFMYLMITMTASAGYLSRSNTNILAATGWRWIGTATIATLHSSPSCGSIASSAPDSPTTSLGIRRWPKQRTDNQDNRLENGLDTLPLLFIPVLHAKTTPLLVQVYHGRLGHDTTTMGECGGQKMEVQIALGGIRRYYERRDLALH